MTSAHPQSTPSLVLVGGPGGAGTSRATASLADRLARTGRRVAVADLDPFHGASARLEDAAVEVLAPTTGEAAGQVGAALDRVGLDPRVATEIATLPGTDVAELLHRLTMASGRPDLDLVLVDLGSRILDVITVAGRLPWLATHLLRAQRGWLSTVRPRTASLLNRWPGADGHVTAQRFAHRAQAWADLVQRADPLLVADRSDPRLRRLQLGLALHELPTPSGVTAERMSEWTDLPSPEPALPAAFVERGDGWAWRLALPGLRSQELRVDRSGDDLALEVLGVRRLVSLPTAMRRFRTAGARVATGHLEITFVPEESRT